MAVIPFGRPAPPASVPPALTIERLEPNRRVVLRRAVARLESLDTEQIQVVEIVIAAMNRGPSATEAV